MDTHDCWSIWPFIKQRMYSCTIDTRAFIEDEISGESDKSLLLNRSQSESHVYVAACHEMSPFRKEPTFWSSSVDISLVPEVLGRVLPTCYTVTCQPGVGCSFLGLVAWSALECLVHFVADRLHHTQGQLGCCRWAEKLPRGGWLFGTICVGTLGMTNLPNFTVIRFSRRRGKHHLVWKAGQLCSQKK